MKHFKFAASLVSLLVLFSSFSHSNPSIETFGRIALVKEIKISPKGTHIAYLRDVKSDYFLVIQNLYKPGEPPVVFSLEKSKIRGFSWVSNNRIVFTATRALFSKGDRETFTMHRTGILDTVNNVAMWPFSGRKFDYNIGRPVLQHKLPNDPEHVLISYFYRSTGTGKTINALYKIRIEDAERSDYFKEAYSNDWVFDIDGNVLVFRQYNARENQYLTNIRDKASEEFEFLRVKKDGESVFFEPRVVSYLPEQKKIYYFERSEQGYWQMLSGRIENDHVVEPKIVSDNSIYDIDTYVSDGITGKLNGYTVIKDFREYSYFDSELAQVQADLEATFPNAGVVITSYSEDRSKFIAKISSFEYLEHYYLYDTKAGSIAAMGEGYPVAQGVTLGKVTKFEYQTSDELNIESYFTLPANLDTENQSRNPSLIVLPHGGPASRDSLEFDWMRQFFASQGFAVFQPNFRGSEGYGKEFEEKGHGEWGKRMQQDVDEGVQALIDQGLVNKDKICVVGASYGGYVAMVAAVTKPKKYKCAVSFAGVSELGNVFYHAEQQLEGLSYWKESIGTRYDAKQLKAYSPLNLADANTSPLLLLHGAKDTVVPAFQSEKMFKRLKELKVESDYIVFPEGDHWFTSGETRKDFLTHSIKFLKRHLE